MLKLYTNANITYRKTDQHQLWAGLHISNLKTMTILWCSPGRYRRSRILANTKRTFLRQ